MFHLSGLFNNPTNNCITVIYVILGYFPGNDWRRGKARQKMKSEVPQGGQGLRACSG
jgi:hypothetical protein